MMPKWVECFLQIYKTREDCVVVLVEQQYRDYFLPFGIRKWIFQLFSSVPEVVFHSAPWLLRAKLIFGESGPLLIQADRADRGRWEVRLTKWHNNAIWMRPALSSICLCKSLATGQPTAINDRSLSKKGSRSFCKSLLLLSCCVSHVNHIYTLTPELKFIRFFFRIGYFFLYIFMCVWCPCLCVSLLSTLLDCHSQLRINWFREISGLPCNNSEGDQDNSTAPLSKNAWWRSFRSFRGGWTL